MSLIRCDICNMSKEIAYAGKKTMCQDCFVKWDSRNKLIKKLKLLK